MNRDEISAGIRAALPTLLSALPFGILLGAVSANMGLSIGEMLLMNMTIYAGASQLVGIELFKPNVAPWIVVASIVAVNFRHILYSAAIAYHFIGSPWHVSIGALAGIAVAETLPLKPGTQSNLLPEAA